MSALGKLFRSMEGGGLAFWCPGCRESHMIRHGPGNGPRWMWNGDLTLPTFSPSVMVSGLQVVRDENGRWTGDYVLGADGEPLPMICHSFVVDGMIQFLGDSTHDLAGQTVKMPEWPTTSKEYL